LYSNKDLRNEPYPSVIGQRPEDIPASTERSTTSAVTALRTSELSETERADEYRRTTKKDEAYWRGRMRDLTTRLDNDRTVLAAVLALERTLDRQLHRNADDVLYIRDRIQRGVVENQWQEAVIEVTRLRADVTNGTRAKANLELEAHAAGIPPGWLVLP
jgi:hypothetical protein